MTVDPNLHHDEWLVQTRHELEKDCKERDIEMVEEVGFEDLPNPVMIERACGIFWACMSSFVVFVAVSFCSMYAMGPCDGYVEIKQEDADKYATIKRNMESYWIELIRDVPGVYNCLATTNYPEPGSNLSFYIRYEADSQWVLGRVKQILRIFNKSNQIDYTIETFKMREKKDQQRQMHIQEEIKKLEAEADKLREKLTPC